MYRLSLQGALVSEGTASAGLNKWSANTPEPAATNQVNTRRTSLEKSSGSVLASDVDIPIRPVYRKGLWWFLPLTCLVLVVVAGQSAYGQAGNCISPISCPTAWSSWEQMPSVNLTINVPGVPPSQFVAEYLVRNCDSSNWELHPYSLRANPSAGANPLLHFADALSKNGMSDSAWTSISKAWLDAGRQLMAHAYQNIVVATNTPSSRYACSNGAPSCSSPEGVRFSINSSRCTEMFYVVDPIDPGYTPNESGFAKKPGILLWYYIGVARSGCNSYQNQFCVDNQYNYNRVCESVIQTGMGGCDGQIDFTPPAGWVIESRSGSRLNLFVP